MGGSEGRCKAGDVEADGGTDDLRSTSPPSRGARRRWWEATTAVVVVMFAVGVYWASKGGDGAEVGIGDEVTIGFAARDALALPAGRLAED